MSSTTAKDELYEKVQEEFSVKLDRRLKLVDLEEQYARLKKEKANPTPKPKLRRPKTVRNVFTGHEFAYSPHFKGLGDLEVIEWHEEDLDDGDD
tara:strand:+ start:125 stop:406 length:282 start_codon:yes stop_codon:yes gene_type:complete